MHLTYEQSILLPSHDRVANHVLDRTSPEPDAPGGPDFVLCNIFSKRRDSETHYLWMWGEDDLYPRVKLFLGQATHMPEQLQVLPGSISRGIFKSLFEDVAKAEVLAPPPFLPTSAKQKSIPNEPDL